MRPSFRKNALAAAIAGAALLGSQAATGAMITEWNYEVDSGFSDFSPEGTPHGVFGLNPHDVAGVDTFTRLEWGDSDPDGARSAFEVTPTVTDPPTLITNGDFVDGAELTHENFPISLDFEEGFLTEATLRTSLLLTPFAPPGDQVGPFPTDLEITFEETPNQPNDGICEDGEPVGDGVHEEGCADIFVLTNPEALEVPSFVIDGFEYTVILDAIGLDVLDDGFCDATGQDAGCIGFVTPENQASTMQAQFRMEARPIAEPLTLGLLGLGLVGIGALTARRREGEDA